MFLRANRRFKDGKEHRYWSIVENRRIRSGRVTQRTVLYLGEINDSQKEAWQKSLTVFDPETNTPKTIRLFPETTQLPEEISDVVQVKLHELSVQRPRTFGSCWLALTLWEELQLDEFFLAHLPQGREGVRWLKVLKLLVVNRLVAPGSEWKIHRYWFVQSAMDELLGEDFAVAEKNRLYRCLDRILQSKEALFVHLEKRWRDLFAVKVDILLYDLTSVYFEGEMEEVEKARYGYSRDHRSDCKQVVIALVVTPDGFPLAYEVMAGNTSDKTTLRDFLKKIEKKYGKARRIWLMDRGIPTEEVLAEMREADPPVCYLVGTPRGRLTKLERAFLAQPWKKVRETVSVKLLEVEEEVYVLSRSDGRIAKERGMRRRRLKKLWQSLKHLQQEKRLKRDELLVKLGGAKKEAGRVYSLVEVRIPKPKEAVNATTFTFSLKKEKLRVMRQREGHYLLRSNMIEQDGTFLWECYIQLTQVEAAFKCLKDDLSIRPIFHQLPHRVEAHILVAFIAYCLMVTLKKRLSPHAPGLTPQAVFEIFGAMQMVDVHLPTTDGRHLVLPRYTHPEKEHLLLLEKLKLQLPAQPPPRIYAAQLPVSRMKSVVET